MMVLSVIRLSLLYGSNYQHLTITITLYCVLCAQAQVLTISVPTLRWPGSVSTGRCCRS